VPRHVVLLTRDTSLAIALKALLGDRDQVSELDSPKSWRTLNGSPVDAVVIDLPPALRKTAVEVLERGFTGSLVVLLGPGESLAKTVNPQRCSVLRRPFGMSELWTLLVASAPVATPEVVPEPQPEPEPAPEPAGERPEAEGPAAQAKGPAAPAVEPRGGSGGGSQRGGSQPAAGGPDRQAPVTAEPAWRWRLRRFQQAPKPSEAGELTEPLPRVDAEANGGAPSPDLAEVEAEAAAAGAETQEAAPAGTAAGAEAEVEAEAAPEVAPAGASRGTTASGVAEVEVAPAGEVAPDTGPAVADEQAISLMDTAIWDGVNEAPQAVATRLARRLRLDVVALMLDNGHGLLETTGGVGLTPAERRLQVEYGHDVLRELFRVGVGLIDDTDRVRSILGGIPFGEADTLMMVPLAYEGHGFGVVLAGRCRGRSDRPDSEFTELEIEALMDFAEDVAPALRSAILLRRLKGQLDQPEGL
jgi:hypothetical protein